MAYKTLVHACRLVLALVMAPLVPLIAACHHDGGASRTLAVQTPCTLPGVLADLPADLVQSGCFDAAGGVRANMVSYEVIAPLWADGGNKGRWLVLPPGTQATFDADGVIDLPVGGGIFKEFAENGVRLETRLLFKDKTGAIQAASWAWNAAQNATTLLSIGESLTLDGQVWNYPSPAQCVFCHNSEAGVLLGARYAQLNRSVVQGNTTVDQITQLMEVDGAITGNRPTALSTLVDPAGTADGALRARSYLSANCSFCHLPNGLSGTATDYRYDTPLAAMGICGVTPTRGDFGIAGAKLLNPGDPNTSILSYRVHSIDAGSRMPPVGRTEEDTAAAALLDEWITKITACP